jgi:hypothetical protein
MCNLFLENLHVHSNGYVKRLGSQQQMHNISTADTVNLQQQHSVHSIYMRCMSGSAATAE